MSLSNLFSCVFFHFLGQEFSEIFYYAGVAADPRDVDGRVVLGGEGEGGAIFAEVATRGDVAGEGGPVERGHFDGGDGVVYISPVFHQDFDNSEPICLDSFDLLLSLQSPGSDVATTLTVVAGARQRSEAVVILVFQGHRFLVFFPGFDAPLKHENVTVFGCQVERGPLFLVNGVQNAVNLVSFDYFVIKLMDLIRSHPTPLIHQVGEFNFEHVRLRFATPHLLLKLSKLLIN